MSLFKRPPCPYGQLNRSTITTNHRRAGWVAHTRATHQRRPTTRHRAGVGEPGEDAFPTLRRQMTTKLAADWKNYTRDTTGYGRAESEVVLENLKSKWRQAIKRHGLTVDDDAFTTVAFQVYRAVKTDRSAAATVAAPTSSPSSASAA